MPCRIYLKSGVGYPQCAERSFIPLLRQPKFRCECGIKVLESTILHLFFL